MLLRDRSCDIAFQHDLAAYYTILYYTILDYTILYYTILYYTILVDPPIGRAGSIPSTYDP